MLIKDLNNLNELDNKELITIIEQAKIASIILINRLRPPSSEAIEILGDATNACEDVLFYYNYEGLKQELENGSNNND